MDVGENYEVKNLDLAEQGIKNLEFAELHMSALGKIKERFKQEKPLTGIKIGLALHITKETGILRKEHFEKMKNGALVSNSGHFDIEIDLKTLKEISQKFRKVRTHLDEYVLNGKKIFVAAEGRLVNLSAAEGHPSEVMSTSFCGQALALEYLVKNRGKLKNDVINLPKEIDDEIAKLQLNALGVEKDSLTNEQKNYLNSWKEGT